MADQIEIRECPRCGGSGIYRGMREPGVCFRCSGSGKIEWNVSAEKRRAKTAENQFKRFWDRMAELVAANPEFEVFFDKNDEGKPHLFTAGVHHVVGSILDTLRMKSAQLSVGQVECLKKFAAGMVAEKTRLAAREAQREAKKANCKHVGKEGEKLELRVTCVAVVSIETAYGMSQLHIFEDAEGNQLKWFTASYPGIEKGATGMLKGTVKSHGMYNEIAQTALVRVKFAADQKVESGEAQSA